MTKWKAKYIWITHQQHKQARSCRSYVTFFNIKFGNPSSVYNLHPRIGKLLMSRDKIAKLIGADISEIYFTGSGTRS